jgi:hypothetical protein
MPERGRYLRGMISWVGLIKCACRITGNENSRQQQDRFQMIHFAMDGIISFSVMPLKLVPVGISQSGWHFGIVIGSDCRIFQLSEFKPRSWLGIAIRCRSLHG